MIKENFKFSYFLTFFFIPLFIAASTSEVPVPNWPSFTGINQEANFIKRLDHFIGIPYRDDGVINIYGKFATWNDLSHTFNTPGLNCSGFVLSSSRFVFMKNFDPAFMKRDRLNDSYKGAPLGKDWDFGWDLIMNIAEDYHPLVLLPEGKKEIPKEANGLNLRGFDIHDKRSWRKIFPMIHLDNFYLATLSKKGNKGYIIMHHHTFCLLKDQKGAVWVYSSSKKNPNRGVAKIEIFPHMQGLELFLDQFQDEDEKILIIETKPFLRE
ncbi:MAG: hypothetical protein DRG20_02910 [Deltaproteobacteria bacterium]|nr:MAG: hypothetical protein DRG20_02910 [Deltaproteobacteria bacterium]